MVHHFIQFLKYLAISGFWMAHLVMCMTGRWTVQLRATTSKRAIWLACQEGPSLLLGKFWQEFLLFLPVKKQKIIIHSQYEVVTFFQLEEQEKQMILLIYSLLHAYVRKVVGLRIRKCSPTPQPPPPLDCLVLRVENTHRCWETLWTGDQFQSAATLCEIQQEALVCNSELLAPAWKTQKDTWPNLVGIIAYIMIKFFGSQLCSLLKGPCSWKDL